jgi:cysteate synthase
LFERGKLPQTIGIRHYALVCSLCGKRQADDGLILECPEDHGPALLQTEYANHQFSPHIGQDGLFRYCEWLPIVRMQKNVGRSVVYRSKAFAKAIGVPNLWIAFNGYWPERCAVLETASFKELEAHTVLGRLPERQLILTVASSGNTGAAFAWACSRSRIPCLLVVPRSGLRRLRFRMPLDPCVSLVVIDDGDYPDAIELAAEVSRLAPFQAEGGVKNVGRRDGLGTVMLSAFEEMRCLPSHYFQAVGSGTGAIAVLEAAKRVRGGAKDIQLPKLIMCQNLPFTPLHDAWRMNQRTLISRPHEYFREAIGLVHADELTNWKPPYEIRGGVYDALTESQGDILVTDNASVRKSMDMFQELEGIDIEPAAGVAVSCLRDAAARNLVGKESIVLLNITGGGRLRFGAEYPLIPAEPRLRLTRKSLARKETVKQVAEVCATAALSG